MKLKISKSEAGKIGAIASKKILALQKQQRIDDWNNNPKHCMFCDNPLSYDKRYNNFCNSSCSASLSNTTRDTKKKYINCLFCNTETDNYKYCSNKCQKELEWLERKRTLINLGIDTSSANSVAKRYLIELYSGNCQICKLNVWQDKPMPLVLDHIDGDPFNNKLTNLRVICNNCDATLPTFKGKNRGNGRFKRAERYEKETIEKFRKYIMIESIADLKFDEKSTPEQIEAIVEEKLGVSISQMKESLNQFLMERAVELPEDLYSIAPYGDYSKMLEEPEKIVTFLQTEATKLENWKLGGIELKKKGDQLVSFIFHNKAVDDGEILRGYVIVGDSGTIRHSFVQTN